jgi:putative ATP-dependent DNA ligase
VYKRQLKYTTSYINIDDIRIGMRAPFDEGRYFIFPRLLRELFQYYERDYTNELIEKKALELGKALICPALNSIRKYIKEKGIGETFELRFHEYEFLEDFIDYMFRLGVDFSVVSIEKKESEIIFRGIKWMKETQAQFDRIIKTGLSPMD